MGLHLRGTNLNCRSRHQWLHEWRRHGKNVRFLHPFSFGPRPCGLPRWTASNQGKFLRFRYFATRGSVHFIFTMQLRSHGHLESCSLQSTALFHIEEMSCTVAVSPPISGSVHDGSPPFENHASSTSEASVALEPILMRYCSFGQPIRTGSEAADASGWVGLELANVILCTKLPMVLQAGEGVASRLICGALIILF